MTVDQRDGVSVVTINRPPVNALDADAVEALRVAFEALGRDPPPKGVVLTGAGAAFSAGVDVRAFGSYDRAARTDFIHAITRMTAALLALPTPLVAAVNGHALGGGFVLMLCADWRICADVADLKLGMPEARAGVPFPAGPLQIIEAELAPAQLRRLALASLTLSPVAAQADGVIDDVAADAVAAALAAAERLSAQPAFATVKRQVRGALLERVRAAADAPDAFLDSFL